MTFVDPEAVAGLPEQAKDVLRELFSHEHDFRARILATTERRRRNELMQQMYDRTWDLLNKYDDLAGTTPYQSGTVDRGNDALAIGRLTRPGRALEVGAGGGSFCAALARAGWTVDGTDLVAAPDWQSISRDLGVRFQAGDLVDLELEAGSYDLCVMEAVMEHLPPGDYEETIRRILSLLRPGGWFVAVVPNSLVGPHDVSRYFLSRGRLSEASHFNERKFIELGSDLKAAGFRRLTTVAYAGLTAGRRFGWSRLWYWKALIAEALFSILPPSLRHPTLFAYMVPTVIAAQK
jgi:2-polyprenyl-3-methyl-5-hydroxy-6-metoxy-1,4-benzoquinol methylase